MQVKSIWRVLALLIIVSLLAAACGGDEESDESASDVEAEAVTVQLNWIHDAAWAGFYIALEEGYYEQQKLTVDLRTVFDDAGNFINTIQAVSSGEADFGVEDAGIFLSAVADGAPLVAVATVYQRHPLAFTSLADSNIKTPQDFKGKTVHVSANSKIMYDALLAAENIDPAEINFIERTDYSPAPLTSGEADVIDAWVVNEVPMLALEDVDFAMLLPSNYGVEMYPNVIFTTQAMINEQPELVERFVRATVQGLQGVHDNRDTAVRATLKHDTEQEQPVIEEAIQRSLPLIKPAGSQPGMMQASVWETSQQILLEQNIISEPVDLESVYTMEFLNAVYE